MSFKTFFMTLYTMQLSKLLYSTILILDTYMEELKDELKQTDIAQQSRLSDSHYNCKVETQRSIRWMLEKMWYKMENYLALVMRKLVL